MGRKSLLAFVVLFLGLSGCTPESLLSTRSESALPAVEAGQVVLLPHHLIVESLIEKMYIQLSEEVQPAEVIIVSPDHFHQGLTPIAPPPDSEFGFTVHRDYALETWPKLKITGFMVQNEATEKELAAFAEELAEHTSALIIFSVDFSHYLPGDVALVHDLRSMDILKAGAVDEARSIEADSPLALEVMLRLLQLRGEQLRIILNTNPAYDAGLRTFENTTHVFGRSQALTTKLVSHPTRTLRTTMFFAHPKEWYLGKTQEDRYLYGYDEVFFDQGGQDHALVQMTGQSEETFTFDYF